MGDRVQVIMIITGVGATPIDVPVRMQRQSISSVPAQPARTEAAAVQNSVGRPAPARVMEPAMYETSSYQTDLDIPAFLRRRNR
jgi:hypothetical protein